MSDIAPLNGRKTSHCFALVAVLDVEWAQTPLCNAHSLKAIMWLGSQSLPIHPWALHALSSPMDVVTGSYTPGHVLPWVSQVPSRHCFCLTVPRTAFQRSSRTLHLKGPSCGLMLCGWYLEREIERSSIC